MSAWKEFIGPYVEHIGSCRHPNDTVFLLVTHKTSQFKLEVWRHDPPFSNDPIQVATLEMLGPAGHGTLECLSDGSLKVYSSGGLKNADRVGGNYLTLPGVAQPWKIEGTVQLLPLPTQSSSADVIARNTAQAALDAAKQARATADTAASDAKKARDTAAGAATLADQIKTSLRTFSIPTWEDFKDRVWQLAGDRIGAELTNTKSPLRSTMKEDAQQVLLAAIAYARENTSKLSALRALIERIIAGR